MTKKSSDSIYANALSIAVKDFAKEMGEKPALGIISDRAFNSETLINIAMLLPEKNNLPVDHS